MGVEIINGSEGAPLPLLVFAVYAYLSWYDTWALSGAMQSPETEQGAVRRFHHDGAQRAIGAASVACLNHSTQHKYRHLRLRNDA